MVKEKERNYTRSDVDIKKIEGKHPAVQILYRNLLNFIMSSVFCCNKLRY